MAKYREWFLAARSRHLPHDLQRCSRHDDGRLEGSLIAERAERRYKQLISKGESVSLPRLLEDIEERDARDSSRSVSPLVPAEDAIVIDSTATPIEQVFDQVMQKVIEKGLK